MDKIEPGDVVVLKSGGPLMTVAYETAINVWSQRYCILWVCNWVYDGIPQQGQYKEVQLLKKKDNE